MAWPELEFAVWWPWAFSIVVVAVLGLWVAARAVWAIGARLPQARGVAVLLAAVLVVVAWNVVNPAALAIVYGGSAAVVASVGHFLWRTSCLMTGR